MIEGRREFLLLDGRRGDIALRLQPLQDAVGLALARMPDGSEFGGQALVKLVAMTWTFEKKPQQGVFG